MRIDFPSKNINFQCSRFSRAVQNPWIHIFLHFYFLSYYLITYYTTPKITTLDNLSSMNWPSIHTRYVNTRIIQQGNVMFADKYSKKFSGQRRDEMKRRVEKFFIVYVCQNICQIERESSEWISEALGIRTKVCCKSEFACQKHYLIWTHYRHHDIQTAAVCSTQIFTLFSLPSFLLASRTS